MYSHFENMVSSSRFSEQQIYTGSCGEDFFFLNNYYLSKKLERKYLQKDSWKSMNFKAIFPEDFSLPNNFLYPVSVMKLI